MAAKVKIIKYPSPNYYPYNNGYAACVWHGTAGPLKASLQRLTDANSNDPVSSSYVVAKTGDVYELVSPYEGKSAWANGVVRQPNMAIPWLVDCIRRGINPNTRTISIEHEADSADMTARNYASMPAAQREASIQLSLQLHYDFGIPITAFGFIGHRDIDLPDKAYCPGVIDIPAQIKEMARREAGNMAQGAANNNDPYSDPNGWHSVVPGLGDFYVIQPVLDHWRTNGGLGEFGYPVSGYGPLQDASGNPVQGKYRQYFERGRIEVDIATGKITHGRVGAELLAALGDKAP